MTDTPDDADETHHFPSRGRLVGAGIAVVALLGVGAAFVLTGDDDGSGESSDSATGETTEADAALDYAKCMRDNGLEGWPDPVIDAEGGVEMDSGEAYDMDMPEVQAAHETCESILEAVNDDRPELTPEELAEEQDRALGMVQCMRDRGWDMLDPEITSSGGGNQVAQGGAPEPGDPDFDRFAQDQEECMAEAGMGDD